MKTIKAMTIKAKLKQFIFDDLRMIPNGVNQYMVYRQGIIHKKPVAFITVDAITVVSDNLTPDQHNTIKEYHESLRH